MEASSFSSFMLVAGTLMSSVLDSGPTIQRRERLCSVLVVGLFGWLLWNVYEAAVVKEVDAASCKKGLTGLLLPRLGLSIFSTFCLC